MRAFLLASTLILARAEGATLAAAVLVGCLAVGYSVATRAAVARLFTGEWPS